MCIFYQYGNCPAVLIPTLLFVYLHLCIWDTQSRSWIADSPWMSSSPRSPFIATNASYLPKSDSRAWEKYKELWRIITKTRLRWKVINLHLPSGLDGTDFWKDHTSHQAVLSPPKDVKKRTSWSKNVNKYNTHSRQMKFRHQSFQINDKQMMSYM